jgi:hypothetical protein
LGLEFVNHSNFGNPQLMLNLRYDDSHQMLLDKLDAAEDITNRLERLEFEVVDLRRGLDALDDTVEATADRIEALEHGISRLRHQASTTEENLRVMISGFDLKMKSLRWVISYPITWSQPPITWRKVSIPRMLLMMAVQWTRRTGSQMKGIAQTWE